MNTGKSLRFLLSISCTTLVAATAHAWDPNAGAEDTYSPPPSMQRLGSTRASAPLPNHIVPRRYYTEPSIARTTPAPSVYQPQPAAAPVASSVTYYRPAPVPTGTIPAPITYQPAPAAPAPVANNSYVPAAPRLATATDYASGQQSLTPPAPAYTPPQPAYAPPIAAAPTYAPTPAPIQPAYSYTPPAYAAAPTTATYPNYPELYPANPVPYQPADMPNHKNRFVLGVETFYDQYQEPDTFPDLKIHSYYGALDLGWEHYFNNKWYGALESRTSYGKANYKSNSGSIHNINDYEFDNRILAGYEMPMGPGKRFRTYAGLGNRYYLNKLKGKVSSIGLNGYERRIFQIYAPVGVSYEFPAYGLTFTPRAELNPLVYGYVQSRLQNFGGETLRNVQENGGLGYRAELMMSRLNERGYGWQFGPFIRYWDVDDSNLDHNGSGGGYEPRNTRLQLGAKFNVLF